MPAREIAPRAPEQPAVQSIPSVWFDGVTKRFALAGQRERVTALEDVSFDVGGGEIVCLLGPSGCGKSTLLKLVAGLERPDAGAVHSLGAEVRGPDPSRGMVFQDHALFPWLDVARNVAFGLEIAGLPRAEVSRRVAWFVQLTGLSGFERAYPHELSGGMKQRVGIARALAMAPSVLLMDEPFGSLDAFTRFEMQEELQALWRRSPFSMLFVTHDVDEAVYLADRIVVMTRRPGRVKTIVPVPLERPRHRTGPEFTLIRNLVLEQYDRAPAMRDGVAAA
ncbi:MAG TPA: ABC transporter ATP-binding protein [Anaeromyxobacter sp.]|nr:ABC transporter ATP-binding protein [Anaeromyxobacter sp.]